MESSKQVAWATEIVNSHLSRLDRVRESINGITTNLANRVRNECNALHSYWASQDSASVINGRKDPFSTHVGAECDAHARRWVGMLDSAIENIRSSDEIMRTHAPDSTQYRQQAYLRARESSDLDENLENLSNPSHPVQNIQG